MFRLKEFDFPFNSVRTSIGVKGEFCIRILYGLHELTLLVNDASDVEN